MYFGHTYLCQKPKESVLANRGDSYWWFADQNIGGHDELICRFIWDLFAFLGLRCP